MTINITYAYLAIRLKRLLVESFLFDSVVNGQYFHISFKIAIDYSFVSLESIAYSKMLLIIYPRKLCQVIAWFQATILMHHLLKL